jgi:beta-glucosidase
VTVTNTSDCDADETVQLYLHQRHGSASRPVRELKGFQRVHLKAGAQRTVNFTVGAAELQYSNADVQDFVLEGSTFGLRIGGNSTANLATKFRTENDKTGAS